MPFVLQILWKMDENIFFFLSSEQSVDLNCCNWGNFW